MEAEGEVNGRVLPYPLDAAQMHLAQTTSRQTGPWGRGIGMTIRCPGRMLWALMNPTITSERSMSGSNTAKS